MSLTGSGMYRFSWSYEKNFDTSKQVLQGFVQQSTDAKGSR